MTTAIKILLILLIGIAFGYAWSFYAYQPLKLAQENQELRANVEMCNSAWVKEFSKKHHLIEVEK